MISRCYSLESVNVTLLKQESGFTDVMQWEYIEIGRVSWSIQVNLICNLMIFLYMKETEDLTKEGTGDVMMEARCWRILRKGHNSRNAEGPWKLEEARKISYSLKGN